MLSVFSALNLLGGQLLQNKKNFHSLSIFSWFMVSPSNHLSQLWLEMQHQERFYDQAFDFSQSKGDLSSYRLISWRLKFFAMLHESIFVIWVSLQHLWSHIMYLMNCWCSVRLFAFVHWKTKGRKTSARYGCGCMCLNFPIFLCLCQLSSTICLAHMKLGFRCAWAKEVIIPAVFDYCDQFS